MQNVWDSEEKTHTGHFSGWTGLSLLEIHPGKISPFHKLSQKNWEKI